MIRLWTDIIRYWTTKFWWPLLLISACLQNPIICVQLLYIWFAPTLQILQCWFFFKCTRKNSKRANHNIHHFFCVSKLNWFWIFQYTYPLAWTNLCILNVRATPCLKEQHLIIIFTADIWNLWQPFFLWLLWRTSHSIAVPSLTCYITV